MIRVAVATIVVLEATADSIYFCIRARRMDEPESHKMSLASNLVKAVGDLLDGVLRILSLIVIMSSKEYHSWQLRP